ncbi:hypothetical protein PanWU01x14_059430 [Parasponia andersonii]|uniref:Uncharacterized protein n=1 Tax=Parasponia andersonii TaxID=3476 RepID=A0A2P5DIH4_PARAD|nr:hypothetical protein PanWU01x14_059430 [Parasponia andersonii]
MKLATVSLSAGHCVQCGRVVRTSCTPRPSCFGGAPIFCAHVHHVCFTRPLLTSTQFPWNSVIGSQPPTLVSRGHVQWTTSPFFSATRQGWCQGILPPACPNARPSARCLSRMLMCVDCVYVPLSRLRACSVCARAMPHTHVLMKPSMGHTHVSHPHVCLGVPPTLCARLAHLPYMLRITPAMHLLAANKPNHAPPKAWPWKVR